MVKKPRHDPATAWKPDDPMLWAFKNHMASQLLALSGGAMKYAICLLGGALMAAGGASVLEVLGVGFLAMAFAWPRGQ